MAYQTPSANGGFALIYAADLPARLFKGRDGTTIPMRSKPKSSRDDRPPEGEPGWKSIRAAKVARARKLVADPNYPPKQVMEAVADLLARKLGEGKRKT